ncbi:MAG TPA: glycerol kinase GlpK [Opitutaceae bacterium]|nr:glycerol kinase GlpK [Opitutaceae bacterium]
MTCILALDQSTSATKALLFDEAGRCLDRESRDHGQYYPHPGWVEHDAGEIWRNTLAVLQALVARHPNRVADLTGLSLTNQRETVVVFERGSGRPLHQAIVWQDRRGDPLCAEQAAAGRETAIHARTGLKLDAYFSGSKLQWLVRFHPELRRQLAAGEALIGTIDAYLIYRLTRGAVFATDPTNASRTLLYDIGRLRWDEELCAWWEVPMAALPEVRESAARFGATTLEGALARPLPICGVLGDSQASLFAQRCFAPGTAKVTFGTGSSVLLNIGSQPRRSERGVLTALAWVIDGVPTYAFEGIIISSAATLAWLRDQLGLVADMRELDRLALEVSDNEGVYLVPAFSGLGLPHWQPAARAAIVGLSARSDRRHVARAGLESITYQVREALDVMRAEAGVPLQGLRGDGGTTANRFLMQFTADLTGVELRIATMADCSPLGAALMGMRGLGIHSDLGKLAAVPGEAAVYRPAMPPERVQQLYSGWQRAVQQVLCATS